MATDSSDVSRPAKEAIGITVLCVLHFLATVLVCIIFLALHPNHLQGLANVLGVLAGALAAVQYLPQIWTTWRLQHVGSLSIPMMCIQTPGGFVFAASLAARLGPSGWSTWAVYLVLAVLQGVLLIMGLSFEYRDWKARQALQVEGGVDGSEQTAVDQHDRLLGEREPYEDTPLLADNRSDRSRSDVAGKKGVVRSES